jgi:hypothetical protein
MGSAIVGGLCFGTLALTATTTEELEAALSEGEVNWEAVMLRIAT